MAREITEGSNKRGFAAINRIMVPIVKIPSSKMALLSMPSGTSDCILLFCRISLKRICS